MKINVMKKVTVKWFSWGFPPDNGSQEIGSLAYLDTVIFEPEPLIKFITDSRNKNYSAQHFTKCYAFLDFCKNAFVIRAPLDLTINIDRNNQYASINNYGQDFFDRCVKVRWNETAPTDRILLTTIPGYVFYADDSLIMESMPLPLTSLENILLVPGRYDIGKWVRPVDYSGEVINPNLPITFKRGDPLFIIRFLCSSEQTIELERVERTTRLLNLVDNCTFLKRAIPNLPLHKAYNMFSSVLNTFRKSKCPFSQK